MDIIQVAQSVDYKCSKQINTKILFLSFLQKFYTSKITAYIVHNSATTTLFSLQNDKCMNSYGHTITQMMTRPLLKLT